MSSTPAVPHHRVAIVGTGFAGLAMAHRCKEAGIHDIVLLERGDEVGGTWRDNTYPGAACDVPSHLYSLSFAPNPSWSRSFSPQPEIQAYLRDCADRFGIRPHVRFRTEVLEARWDDEAAKWELRTSAGPLTATILVTATGPLSDPKVPDLPGLDTFPGTVFHSARWDHDHDLRGERVAVVGTGASAIQFVPQIQPYVASLALFQRTPPWIVPRWDRPYSRTERWLFRHVPLVQRLARAAIYWGRETYAVGFTRRPQLMRGVERLARWHMRRQVPDAALRERLTPDYQIGCKRILISNDYYPAVSQPNVEVIPSGIAEVRGSTVIASDGTEREVDAIIFGTGFHVTDMPIAERVTGRTGVTLADHWKDHMAAHRGTTVADFPNMFVLCGPNTGLGHSSQVFMIESQVTYAVDALRAMRERGADIVEVRPEAEAAWNERVQEKMGGTVWTTGGCSSWYLDDSGRNPVLWPDFTFRFRQETRRFDDSSYRLVDVPEPAEAAHV